MLKIRTVHQGFLSVHVYRLNFQRNFWSLHSCVINLGFNNDDVGFSEGIRMKLLLEA